MELEEQIKIAVESCGVTLYEVGTAKDHSENIFRVTITKAGGISLDKCQEVSKMISPLLDINEPMKGKYRLEVSSPGIERKLKNIDHIKASVGEKIKGKEYSTETFRGELLSVDEDNTLHLKDEDGNEFSIKYDDILACSTYYDWK
jgi:ribosome maturation factor RimP